MTSHHINANNPESRTGDVQAPPKRISLAQNIKAIYYEYCSNTSLHGVEYFGQRRPRKEIYFWLCIFVLAIGFCSQSIVEIYQKLESTPVIVTFSERSTDIWNIPFPAITICSEIKRPKTKGPSYNDLLLELQKQGEFFKPNITSSELNEFLTLLHLCTPTDEGLSLNGTIAHPSFNYKRIIDDMASGMPDYIVNCIWQGSNCSQWFSKTYTEEGLCYTFNGLDMYRDNTVQSEESFEELYSLLMANQNISWSLDDGYDVNSAFETYPFRVLGSGSRAGIMFLLQSFKKDIDYGCRGISPGYKLVLHPTGDVPIVSAQFIRIPTGGEVMVAVTPNMMTTSDSVANYDPQKRLCYMNNERYLRFFDNYTESNCELECLTNYTLTYCGCVKFSMPRTPDMPVCHEDSINCYEYVDTSLLNDDSERDHKGSKNKCNCMPACNSIKFDAEISQGDFDTDSFLKAGNIPIVPGMEYTVVSVYYKRNEFITTKRSELYGLYDFVAALGGILGLFTGFSILSAIEFIYHFTLRLCSNMRRMHE